MSESKEQINEKKLTLLEHFAIEFREWHKEWEIYNEQLKNKPRTYDEFMTPFLKMEQEQLNS